MIYVRASTLEAYRRCVETDFGREDELVTAIEGGQVDTEGTWQQRCGTAFHAILANPEKHHRTAPRMAGDAPVPVDEYHAGEWHWYGPTVRDVLAELGPGRCEVRAGIEVPTRWGPVTVSGQADRLSGLCVRDAKCTWSAPDPELYEPSLQWRWYLLIHERRWFCYDLFHMKEPAADGLVELKEFYSFRQWGYEGMEQHCKDWLSRFLAWACNKGLLEDLERKPNY